MNIEQRDELIDQYSDLYRNEQYTLAASSALYLPYFVCSVHCSYKKKLPMSSLDMILCKCIERKITAAQDIAFVLALELGIVEELLNGLIRAEVLAEREGTYSFTQKGIHDYESQSREQQLEDRYEVYFNGITGEWSTQSPAGLISEPQQDTIRLQPIHMADSQMAEKRGSLWSLLEQQYDISLLQVKMQEYKTIRYQEQYILFYRNENGNLKFNVYDEEQKQFNIGMNQVLLERYAKGKLYELMQAQKEITAEEPLLEQYAQNVTAHQYYRNKELREIFKNIFQTAKESVLIVSPWIDSNGYVVTESFLQELEKALKNKLEITIGYGYLSYTKMQEKLTKYRANMCKADKDISTELMAQKLKKRFSSYPGFTITYMGTHEKILSYDNRYTIIGSFNFLSYDGGEGDNYRGRQFRLEGGVFIEDVEFAAYVKNQVMEGKKG